MGIVVRPEVHEHLWEDQNLLVEVRSDDRRLPAGMAALRRALLRLEGPGYDGQDPVGPSFVSEPIPLPGRQLLLVDFGPMPPESIDTVPDLLARHLHDAGVHEAVVSVAPQGELDVIEDFGLSVRAYLRGPLGAPFGDTAPRPPLPLLDVALNWLRSERRPADPLSAVVLGVWTPVTAETVRPVTAAVLSTPPMATSVALLAGDLTDRLLAATVGSGYGNATPAAALTTAPPGAAPADLAGAMRGLRDLLRAHTGVLVWAGVDAEPDSRRVLLPRWSQRTPEDGTPVTARPEVELLADELIPDAMWYQILSTGHLDRLGGLPRGAVPLSGGRAELTIGEPEQWLPGHPDAEAVRERGRELLGGCLVDEAEAFALSAARVHRAAPGRDR